MGTYEFKFPDVAEGITEGILVDWKVKEGETIQADQVLCEMETDKSVLEIPSPKAGKVVKLHGDAGAVIAVGAVLVTLEVEGEETTEAPSSEDKKEEPETPPAVHQSSNAQVLPKDRKLANTLGVELDTVEGTGTSGRITEDDIKAAAGKPHVEKEPEKVVEQTSSPSRKLSPSMRKQVREGGTVEPIIQTQQSHAVHHPQPTELPVCAAKGERKKIQGIRAVIKKRMETSWRTIPHASIAIEVEFDKLMEERSSVKETMKEKGIHLTYLAYIAKVVATALEEYPEFNVSVDEQTQEIVQREQINVGIATDTDYGLIVPNIKECNTKSIGEIAKEIQELAEKARDKKLKPEEITAGTFTITNVGSFRAVGGTSIINYPEAAILQVGFTKEQITLIDGKPAVKHLLPLTLTFDHRILDGGDAGRFMHFLSQHLSDPSIMLVDVI